MPPASIAIAVPVDSSGVQVVKHVARRLAEAIFCFEALLCLSTLALIGVAIPRSMADPDIWWHLLNAKTMLSQHGFIRHDLFSFTTQGAPWIDHEWLAEIPFYWGWRVAGANGVYLVTVATIEAIFAGLLFLCWRASRNWSTTCIVTVLAALLSTVSFGPRTLLFGWVCLVFELIVLQGMRSQPALAWFLPLLFALWVNLHGSWIIGVFLLVAHTLAGFVCVQGKWVRTYVFDRQQKRNMLFAWPGVLLALFVNPWTWRLVAYPFNLAFRQTLNVANVQEWQNLDLHSFRGRLVGAVLLLIICRQFSRPRRWAATELTFLCLGLWSCLTYSRFLFLFALLAAPIVARSFPSRNATRPKNQLYALNAALMLAILELVCLFVVKQPRIDDANALRFPTATLPILASLPPRTRLFNEFAWGGYIEWWLPGRPVFIDSRVDIFEYNGTFRDYLAVIRIDSTLALLDRYKINAVLFEKKTPLVYLLMHTDGWRASYDDGSTVLLERSNLRTVEPRMNTMKTQPI